VREGDALVHFDGRSEQHELDRINREFELMLVRSLRDPTDQGARQSLTALRAQRELAQARLDERTVRASQAGIVSDIRIRAGQGLAAGDKVLSLLGEDSQFWLLALLPGQYRPLLHPGMPLRVEMVGYPYEYRTLTIDSIQDEVVGPGEVRRYLPPDIADAVPLPGPTVLVRARIPSPTFTLEGQSFRYYEGMLSSAEARVRSERILVALVPALKALFHSDGWPRSP
jgi:membrane fusion protein (multidrug efflux system)